MNPTPLRKALGLFGLCAILLGVVAATGHGQQNKAVRQFMRQKLDHSQKVLEGLMNEDYDQIAKNARLMRELSEDAQWRISPNISYIRLSTEFQGLADELARKAKDHNLDGATLAYVKLTMNCVECHRLVRDERLIALGNKRHAPGF
jgi:hypothetical protein